MTLLYWWMHWFWITLIGINSNFGLCGDEKSQLDDHSTISSLLNVDKDEGPFNLTLNMKHKKFLSPTNKFNITINNNNLTNNNNNNNNNSKNDNKNNNFFSRKTTVIHNQDNDTSLNSYDNNQTAHINSIFNQTTIKTTIHPDNFTYIGDEHYNNISNSNNTYNNSQNLLINSKRIIEGDNDDVMEINENDDQVKNRNGGGDNDNDDDDDDDDDGNTTNCAENLTAASITGITLGCIIIVGVVCIVTYIVYRNRGFNRPQVLNDRCSNPDSSIYIDDASIRDNSEEMYSLDNDSFLNSLEAMTIQNYWTDTVKHTKL